MASTADPGTHAPVPELSAGTHFPCLDAYRGIGMVMVLLSHASFATGHTDSVLGPYLSRFELAVPMFFVLSGFLLFRPYAVAMLEQRPPLTARRFLRRRALRIIPGYWVALGGIVLLFGAGVLTDAWTWTANIFLLQQFGVDEPFRINQAWSIGVEISFYLFLPAFAALVALAVRRLPTSPRTVCYLATASLYLAGGAFRCFVVATEPGWQLQSLAWLPMYLDFFAIGMALSVASATDRVGLPPVRPLHALASRPGWCWAAAFAIFLAVAQMDPPDTPFGLNGGEYLPRQFAYGIAAIIWLTPAMFGDQTVGNLRRTLASRPLSYLGAISFSFYLWHLELIHQAQAWTVAGYDELTGLAVFTGNFWLVATVAFVTTFAVAALLHRVVEVPLLHLKDRPLRALRWP